MRYSLGSSTIRAVLFDFGGVLAEEGFSKGLMHIPRSNELNAEEFIETAVSLVISSGYLTGHLSEALYWDQLRARTGIRLSDNELRQIILKQFILRDWMIELVKKLNEASLRVFILSDQTNWLDELNEKLHFFDLFERVFNSYHIGKSKNDPSLFTDILTIMDVSPQETLFVDDTLGHVQRARSKGLHAIHYKDRDQFFHEMEKFFPELVPFG